MEETFKHLAGLVATGVEAIVVLLIAVATIEATIGTVLAFRTNTTSQGPRRKVWLRYAGWILLALEFALAADIIRTAIAPTWEDIGSLAAIAAIRTALNYFLERDIESLSKEGNESPVPSSA